MHPSGAWLNTLKPRQDGRHFPDDIFKCIFLNENVWISMKIPLKFVPKGPINNIPLFQIMAWRRPGDKPWYETMMVTLLTHICVTRPQWVKKHRWTNFDKCNNIDGFSLVRRYINLSALFKLQKFSTWESTYEYSLSRSVVCFFYVRLQNAIRHQQHHTRYIIFR